MLVSSLKNLTRPIICGSFPFSENIHTDWEDEMKMKETGIGGVLILEPTVFTDERGYFFEAFNQKDFNMAVGCTTSFVQDNQSRSRANVLRGLHYQIQKPQGKLVRVLSGIVFDVVVDIRRNSPTLGRHTGVILSSENKNMLWIPPGFAHGFLVVSGSADVLYKVTEFWTPSCERTICWNDPDLAIPWPVKIPVLSEKDAEGEPFATAELF